jgi:hypothetical protein
MLSSRFNAVAMSSEATNSVLAFPLIYPPLWIVQSGASCTAIVAHPEQSCRALEMGVGFETTKGLLYAVKRIEFTVPP